MSLIQCECPLGWRWWRLAKAAVGKAMLLHKSQFVLDDNIDDDANALDGPPRFITVVPKVPLATGLGWKTWIFLIFPHSLLWLSSET